VKIDKLDGSEPITNIQSTVKDFWAWGYSDILSNRNRSVFAEFLVATALDVAQQPRVEWDAVDLRYQGKKIEVKSSGYLQSWHQTKLSKIQFDIAPKAGWDADSNVQVQAKMRSADCYVFCVYEETNPNNMNIF
jgi:hypothetical protein